MSDCIECADSPMSDYDKQEKALADKVQKIARNSKSTILKDLAQEKKAEYDDTLKQRCRLVRMVVDEAINMYREGEMTFEEMKKDIPEALKAID